MNKHPRTEQARNEALQEWRSSDDELSLNYFTAKTLDTLCRELETELNEAKAIVEQYLIVEQLGLKNKIDRLESELNAANAIIQATLNELPVGYIPSHTTESIPERVRHFVKECARMEEELSCLIFENAAYDTYCAYLRDVANNAKQ